MYELWRAGMPLKPQVRKRRQDYTTGCHVHRGCGAVLFWVQHYVFPQQLQIKVFGEVKDTRSEWLCPNAELNVLELIKLGAEHPDLEGAKACVERHISCSTGERTLAVVGLARYYASLDNLAELRANGPWAVHPNNWRCPDCGGSLLLTAAGGKRTWTHACEGRSVSHDGLASKASH